ncbi:MAG: threonine synthase [Bacteroidales bacterium]|nr:threonine synthase [Bacteroidales bacterium]
MNKTPIRYYSTNLKAPEVSFGEALLKGLAPDGGLYMPVSFPVIASEELASYSGREYYEIAFSFLSKFLGTEIPADELLNLCKDAYNFDIPLEKVTDRKYIMRLDQGPTASFKDFAARMMSRLMQYYLSINNKYLTILTATSGDTGSAVASAFYGLKNINVIILFPAEEITAMQRKQMTTLQKNIKVLSVDGKFDNCQDLVKKAFRDPSLSHLPLSSANSINIGRLLPQAVFYIYAWSRLNSGKSEKAVFSVPSGNFGNLMAGLIAFRTGLPIKKFIVTTNENKEVPEFLKTGIYNKISPSKNCISSAMNVGHPSNLARIIALYGGIMDENGNIIREPDIRKMREHLHGISFSDNDTREAIADIYRKYNIILEPHGALAWLGIKDYSESVKNNKSGQQLYISLETAHPAKFPEEIIPLINFNPPLPQSLAGLTDKEEKLFTIGNDYNLLKEFILKDN